MKSNDARFNSRPSTTPVELLDKPHRTAQMLETVRSRQIYGFLVLTVLPASFAIGYYLKDREERKVDQAVSSPIPAFASTTLSQSSIEERIRTLKRQRAELDREKEELVNKLGKIGLKE
ncbi:hypothetical protein T439DRAFT_336302 [Meredithblackwellia eburnea MCA 4105]